MHRRAAKAGALLVALFAFAAVAPAATIQKEGLRITVLSQILPYKLPREGTAPIAVFISGHIATPSGAVPPQLQRMTIKVNRHGLLQAKGLPTCGIAEIQPGSSARAIRNCGDALVGSGRFWASIVLPDQRPYPTRGRLLVFNGKKNGRHVLYAHIFTRNPFANSFVVTFDIRRIDDGSFGTELSASLPQALGDWGFVDRIKLTLRRKYTYRGKQRSYFNAGCPALKNARTAVFPLALASFAFEQKKQVSLGVTKSCGVKE
jgi:hypothetical protein